LNVTHSAEERMIQPEQVQEILARLARGEKIKTLARELGVDRKTIKRWRRLGGWHPRQRGRRRRQVEPFMEFVARRGPEVDWNAVVLYRELQGLGFGGSYRQVQRATQPCRVQRAWTATATVRFETAPGEQAQVDFGQVHVWVGEHREKVHLFVFTLGYSRRLWVRAYPHERLSVLLDGHERAFQHFGGVPLTCLYDNPRTLVLGRRERQVLWHPVVEDFAGYYGFTPRACQPYRARTKAPGWRSGRAPWRISGSMAPRMNGRSTASSARRSRRSGCGPRIGMSASVSAGCRPMRWSPSPRPGIRCPCNTWARR
jgi:transposase